MQSLSCDILCMALAKLPFSKSKIAMQTTCKLFKAALTSTTSHSIDTFDDDEYMCGDISNSIVENLRHFKTDYYFPSRLSCESLQTLCCDLETMKLEEFYECPHLTRLDVQHCEEVLEVMSDSDCYNFASSLPALEIVNVESLPFGEINQFMDELGKLPRLRKVHIDQIDEIPALDWSNPCDLSLCVRSPFEPLQNPQDLSVPAATAPVIRELRFPMVLLPMLDLQEFADCSNLRYMHFNLFCSSPLIRTDDRVLIKNISRLPRSCSSIEFKCHGFAPYIEVTDGWDVMTMHSDDSCFISYSRKI